MFLERFFKRSKSIYGNIEPKCSYCERYKGKVQGDKLLCPKAGIVSPDYSCSKFKYDPLRRSPETEAEPDPSKFSDDDFKL